VLRDDSVLQDDSVLRRSWMEGNFRGI